MPHPRLFPIAVPVLWRHPTAVVVANCDDVLMTSAAYDSPNVVWVAAGEYSGFRVRRGGTADRPLQIAAAAGAYDVCVVHDLFEHLSIAGMEQAIAETMRVTRRRWVGHFFRMHDAADHEIQPIDDYHWNTLSLPAVPVRSLAAYAVGEPS